MIRRIVKPLARAARWAFGEPAPGFDIGLAVLAAGWALTAGFDARVFEQQSYAVLRLMSPQAFAAIMATLAVLHLASIARPRATLRQVALYLSALVWLSVAAGFALAYGWTAVSAYGVIGFGTLLLTFYVETER